jgi:hypothetical protein
MNGSAPPRGTMAHTAPPNPAPNAKAATAPDSGIVLYICAVPTMTKGVTIANIGVPVR